MSALRSIVHRDGTVTYWSVYAQCWRRHVTTITTDDALALPSRDRARVVRACNAVRSAWIDETAHYRAL